MFKIKGNFEDIKTSSTLAINELSKKLEKEGREIFKFGLGQSPFPIPSNIVKELQNNAHKKEYLNVSGLFKLRKKIAQYHSEKNKYSYTADEVIIGPGSKELIFQAQLILEGDLLLPIPSWVSYEPQAHISNKKIHWIETTAKDNWHLSPKSLDNHCKKIKNVQKLLILNSPNNPSGTIHPNLKELATVAKAHNLIIIADEIYAELNFEGNYESITHYYPNGTIISSGISKWCGAGGWRLGNLVFPKELKNICKVLRSVVSETFTSVSAPIQYAAIKAYSEDHTQYLYYSRKILKCIANYIYKKLTDVGVLCQKPQGGFYILCDFSSVISKTNEIVDSKSFCSKILDETGFAMLPGLDFGISKDRLIARLAFVDFDGRHVLNIASKNVSLDDKFVMEHCPKISRGIESLIDWLNQRK